MLTRTAVGDYTNISSKQTVFAGVVALMLFAALTIVFHITNIPGADGIASGIAVTSIKDFSDVLFSKYALPFEVASVLLLAALVGSVVLAVKGKQEEDKGQKQTGDSTAAGKKKKTK
jgi:NADH:ubiquinone oxidoreductase subunit 6 (subunit J)